MSALLMGSTSLLQSPQIKLPHIVIILMLIFFLVSSNYRPSIREELFNMRNSSLRNVIERTFGVLKHCFKILATTSEYKLKQQYNIVIASCCVHNINILCNGQSDDIFSESNQTSHIEECKNWRDGLAEDMWVEYVRSLEMRYG
ncbi:uncharacterized protein VP01_2596g4 [Puccinia sorghi]|uniref:DDE Tnp4 domain-containing protein n=1 Tax=Puccinia sorghi TaxID=27349 RepID=A0A0L6V4P7_9BASI|nr:uncharacterized protein VP01_2596g4 [Puccinia sorghi]